MRLIDLTEKFSDIGKFSDVKLKKGKRISPSENAFKKVEGRIFHKIVSKIRNNDIARGLQAKGLETLTVYDVTDYQQMDCYIGSNNSSGYALKKSGELVSVFSSQGSSGDAIVSDAVKNGASHLDCFATRDKNGNIGGPLYKLYLRHGFKIDTTMNEGTKGEPYAIVNGVSDYVDDAGNVHPENENVVIFMKK